MLALAAALLAMTPTATATIYAALGDSTGVGVGARSGGGYPTRLVRRGERDGLGVRLVNLCVSGARVADVAAGQLDRAVAARPALVTLGVGINDVTHGTDLDAFARAYDRVAAELAATGARVLVLNVPDLSLSPLAYGADAKRALRRRIEGVNEVIAAAARRHGFRLVDLFAASEEEMGRPGLLADDQFHPSDAGYERWADLVQGPFEAALRAGAGLPSGALSTERPLR